MIVVAQFIGHGIFPLDNFPTIVYTYSGGGKDEKS